MFFLQNTNVNFLWNAREHPSIKSITSFDVVITISFDSKLRVVLVFRFTFVFHLYFNMQLILTRRRVHTIMLTMTTIHNVFLMNIWHVQRNQLWLAVSNIKALNEEKKIVFFVFSTIC